MIRYILYKSRRAAPGDVSVDTVDIVATSIRNNRQNGITGFLHVENDAFYQFIEGDGDAVEALFKRISGDRRHFSVTQIASRIMETRLFPDWDMGFVSAEGRRMCDAYFDAPDRPSADTVITFLKSSRDRLDAARGAHVVHTGRSKSGVAKGAQNPAEAECLYRDYVGQLETEAYDLARQGDTPGAMRKFVRVSALCMGCATPCDRVSPGAAGLTTLATMK